MLSQTKLETHSDASQAQHKKQLAYLTKHYPVTAQAYGTNQKSTDMPKEPTIQGTWCTNPKDTRYVPQNHVENSGRCAEIYPRKYYTIDKCKEYSPQLQSAQNNNGGNGKNNSSRTVIHTGNSEENEEWEHLRKYVELYIQVPISCCLSLL